jgi:ATP-dependent helicase HrpA
VELALAKDFAWLQKDLRALNRFAALTANLCPLDELEETALENLRQHLLPAEVFPALTEAAFRAVVEQTRLQIPGLAAQLVDRVGVILQLRAEIQRRCGPAPALPAIRPRTMSSLSQLSLATRDAVKPASLWAEELDTLVPRRFLAVVPFARLTHLPRYLKALATRMERARLNPAKDQDRARQLAPYLAALKERAAEPPKTAEARQRLADFRWLVEEYKVSVFAQELGTAVPVSAKRLDQQLQGL